MALAAAVIVGVTLAVLFTQSKWLEMALLPYAVILQVTPIVAIAPLIIIWAGDINLSLLICAWIVAFFPILSNTILGLNSADHNLINFFQLHGATRWQTLRHLKLPAALPYFLAGLKISGGLALIGAVVAEFVAGTGGSESGLAYRILEAGYQLKIPRVFAALADDLALGHRDLPRDELDLASAAAALARERAEARELNPEALYPKKRSRSSTGSVPIARRSASE
jgi:NitT/TauT family transport system permease protein